ncbi:MAG: hypothetical protein H6739_25730 [Alphaproteobacteria bacterium]|nr:hypothetical protein [Alphaproteobacteria bacterium]
MSQGFDRRTFLRGVPAVGLLGAGPAVAAPDLDGIEIEAQRLRTMPVSSDVREAACSLGLPADVTADAAAAHHLAASWLALPPAVRAERGFVDRLEAHGEALARPMLALGAALDRLGEGRVRALGAKVGDVALPAGLVPLVAEGRRRLRGGPGVVRASLDDMERVTLGQGLPRAGWQPVARKGRPSGRVAVGAVLAGLGGVTLWRGIALGVIAGPAPMVFILGGIGLVVLAIGTAVVIAAVIELREAKGG